ncbi:MAG: putative Na+/H+ antiporter [Akkermansiaceae bacterium]
MRKLTIICSIFALFATIMLVPEAHAAKQQPAYERGEHGLDSDQHAVFPKPLASYEEKKAENGEMDLMATLKYRAFEQGGFNIVATIIFICAIVHTFLAGFFIEMAHKHEHRQKELNEKRGRTACAKPEEDAKDDVSFRAHLFHFLGEVEAIFGIWVIALVGAVVYFFDFNQAVQYVGHDVNFTEPLFVVIIMAISATRPVIRFAEMIVGKVAGLMGGGAAAWWLSVLTITPLLGSFITEPAAMTIAAMLLAKWFYDKNPPAKFAYATLGLLFVNISVGGTLTHFAAPPVLMIAEKWHFGMGYMFMNFGWKAIIGILIANALYFMAFRKHFASLKSAETTTSNKLRWNEREDSIPLAVTLTHLGFLAFTVLTAHYPVLFIGGFMFFLGFTQATGHHQNDVSMKSPLLVGFFLAGLVIHGGCQGWWIEPLLMAFQEQSAILMKGATVLTAFNDNAAITYLASQAPSLGITAKYAVLAGAVTGGGLTVIANAPNPAGQSVLGKYFEGGVSPLKLALSALVPTIIMGLCFMLFPSSGMTEDPKIQYELEHPKETPSLPGNSNKLHPVGPGN